MERIRNKELECLLDNANELDWSYVIYQEPKKTYDGCYCNERNYVELEKYSPAGEDFSMIIDFDDNPIDSFMENLKEYANDFDIDEHVEMWIPERGKGGCPRSISELLEDAEAIIDMIVELYETLNLKVSKF